MRCACSRAHPRSRSQSIADARGRDRRERRRLLGARRGPVQAVAVSERRPAHASDPIRRRRAAERHGARPHRRLEPSELDVRGDHGLLRRRRVRRDRRGPRDGPPCDRRPALQRGLGHRTFARPGVRERGPPRPTDDRRRERALLAQPTRSRPERRSARSFASAPRRRA